MKVEGVPGLEYLNWRYDLGTRRRQILDHQVSFTSRQFVFLMNTALDLGRDLFRLTVVYIGREGLGRTVHSIKQATRSSHLESLAHGTFIR